MGKYRDYTDEDIIKYAKEVYSAAGLLKKLDLVIAGGNYAQLYRNLKRLQVDTSHWTGCGWTANQQLKKWEDYVKPASVKRNLLKIRLHKCERCLNSEWMGQKIPLEVHHINGDRTDHAIENIELLCCNCHALTDNWRGKKRP